MAGIIPSAGTRLGIGLSTWLRILDFRGRSTRSEVLYFFVVTMLLGVVLLIAFSFAGYFDVEDALRGLIPDRVQRVELAAALGFIPFLPIFALSARRLHDIGLPGWPGPLIALAAAVIGSWKKLHFVTGGAVAELSWPWELLHIASVIAFWAILLWAPQRHTNRYGPDPRLDPDPDPSPAAM